MIPHTGRVELRDAIKKNKTALWTVGIFSAFANLLMLTGPLYMLQVYDRVLGSRSIETLVALSMLVAFLYAVMGILDYARGRMMARIGARFQASLDRRVFEASNSIHSKASPEQKRFALADLEVVQRLISSPAATGVFDLPWVPIFLFGIAIFHPWLGILSLLGGIVLTTLAVLNQVFTARKQQESQGASRNAERLAEGIRRDSESLYIMGMLGDMFSRWNIKRSEAASESLKVNDTSGSFTAASKTLRLVLQSAMLGLGAYLVLQNELSPGAMIAGSILLGRALAPVEAMLSQWPLVQRSRAAWGNLSELLSNTPPQKEKTELPHPKANLVVEGMSVVPAGSRAPTLRNISFRVNPGEALGVLGQSGSGKTTIARALVGALPLAAGAVRLDGPTLDQYDQAALGTYVGYLPQTVRLFEGTIAENIGRMSGSPDPEKVVKAAKKAAAHDLIVKLPNGYDTVLDINGAPLSGGQIQRIGLARALYGDPVLIILDEPNSNLDHEGSVALNQAIKSSKDHGAAVVIMAHRPSAIELCDTLTIIDRGVQAAYGPKNEVLKKTVQNAQAIIEKGPAK